MRSYSLPSICRRPWVRWPVALLLFALSTALLPRWWCGRDGSRWFQGDSALVVAHAREVATTIREGVSTDNFTNGSDLFRNEWQFGTYQMGALALLQVCLEHPSHRAEFLPAAERAIDEMLSDRIRAFDAARWKEDPLASLDSPLGHAAYLGYLNLVLGLHRSVVPESRYADLNNRITAALVRRLRAAPHGGLETYPEELYPLDNAAVLGSILLHQRLTGTDHRDVTEPMLARYRQAWRDPNSGLLYQALSHRSGQPVDYPRASGTALAAMLLSYGDRAIARTLYQSVRDHCHDSLLGFGYINEYAHGSPHGSGDVDSGPLIFGISPSASGFMLASARMFGDRDEFISLYRTAHLVGTPTTRGDRRLFITGGPLGNALLLAMLTARPEIP